VKKKIRDLVDFIIDQRNIIYPCVLVIAVAVTVIIALTLNNKDQNVIEQESFEVVASTEEISVEPVEEVDTSLVLTDDARLKDLFNAYYEAYAQGDVEKIRGMCNYLLDTEAMVIAEMSKYIISYPAIEVYVKPGPLKDSYLAYVYFSMMFDGYPDQAMPGLEIFYVCTDETTGQLFINNMGFGIDGYCCEVADQIKEKEPNKEINYAGIAIKGLLFHFKSCHASVSVDGKDYEFDNVWIAPTMKGRFYGGGMNMAPAQDRNSDKLSLVIYRSKSTLKALMQFPSIFKGEHVKNTDMVTILTGNKIKVKFSRPCAAQIDGETVLNVSEYEAELLI